MKLEKKHWIIIVIVIVIWYLFFRKKKTESGYSKNWVTEGFPNLESSFKSKVGSNPNPTNSIYNACMSACNNTGLGSEACGGFCGPFKDMFDLDPTETDRLIHNFNFNKHFSEIKKSKSHNKI